MTKKSKICPPKKQCGRHNYEAKHIYHGTNTSHFMRLNLYQFINLTSVDSVLDAMEYTFELLLLIFTTQIYLYLYGTLMSLKIFIFT